MDATTTTFKQAVCGRKYRKATWVAIVLSMLFILTGIGAFNVYTKRMLETMIEQAGDDSFPMTPLQGS